MVAGRLQADAAVALALAQMRYWLTVAPEVRAELRRWRGHADAIADPVLRAHAESKLRDEAANTEAIATLCTLAPLRHRKRAVVAAVALQVMYDYLDAVTEDRVPDPLLDGRQLFRCFAVALTPGEAPTDYYRYHPQRDDSGYLDLLVRRARLAIEDLPGLLAVLPVARRSAVRFAEAQTRSHAIRGTDSCPLRRWAEPLAKRAGLSWWEWAGGAAASILALHALLAAAADPRVTNRHAAALDQLYLLSSALTTMLDSLVDYDGDRLSAAHSFVAYYPSIEEAGQCLASLARRTVAATRDVPHSSHHAMTVAGIAAFYLSTPLTPRSCVVAEKVVRELRPLVVPILAGFRAWRVIRARSGR